MSPRPGEAPPVLRLQELGGFLAPGPALRGQLFSAAADIARALKARSCSVMLFTEEGADGEVRLALAGAHGDLPEESWVEPVALGERIAGEVARTATSLLVPEMRGSAWAARSHGRESAGQGALCVPLVFRGRVLGVLNASGPAGNGRFCEQDLRTVEVITSLLCTLVQASQLQKILDSRFAQIALTESEGLHAGIMEKSMPPEKAAHIVAKSLFREMTRAGFSEKQIIRTASDILGELNDKLRKDRPSESPDPDS